jgi:Flp pilus assembly protein TadG
MITSPAGQLVASPPVIRPPTNRGGTAAMELALVLPVLLLLALGCVDLGRAISLGIVLSNAARVGAEYGATHRFTAYTLPSWQTQIKQDAAAEVQAIRGFDASQLTLVIQTGTDSAGDVQVTVTASYPFQTVSSWPGLPDSFLMQQSVTDRQYQ